MVEEWCGPTGRSAHPALPRPAVGSDAGRRRGPPQRRPRLSRGGVTELPANLGLPSLPARDRHWDPFLAACDETAYDDQHAHRIRVEDAHHQCGRTVRRRDCLTSLNAYLSMADWLLSGVMARFPHLKIAYSESQVGWMPFLIERLDSVFTKSGAWADLDPALTELPSSYVPGRVYGQRHRRARAARRHRRPPARTGATGQFGVTSPSLRAGRVLAPRRRSVASVERTQS
jgi:hypothetical protein